MKPNVEYLDQFIGKEVKVVYQDGTSCSGHMSVYYGRSVEYRVYDFDVHYSYLLDLKEIKEIIEL